VENNMTKGEAFKFGFFGALGFIVAQATIVIVGLTLFVGGVLIFGNSITGALTSLLLRQ
jgi:hypothetical protein